MGQRLLDDHAFHLFDIDLYFALRDVNHGEPGDIAIQPHIDDDISLPSAPSYINHIPLYIPRTLRTTTHDVEVTRKHRKRGRCRQ